MALPTVKIQGKDYTLVKDRILYFNETFPNGCIQTELLTLPEADKIVVRATVIPDVDNSRFFRGHSQAVVGQGNINRTAALENAETSAVGRALGFMGIGVIESVASADEIHKAKAPAKPIPNDDLPPQMYDDTPVIQRKDPPLDPGLVEVSKEMEQFVPLTKERNEQIQARLGEISKNTINRRKLSLFLERVHGGKKSIDVSATQWEATMKSIEDAIAGGEDAIKALLKG